MKFFYILQVGSEEWLKLYLRCSGENSQQDPADCWTAVDVYSGLGMQNNFSRFVMESLIRYTHTHHCAGRKSPPLLGADKGRL